MSDLNLPIPFSITIHGIAYDREGISTGAFPSAEKLLEDLESVVHKHLNDGLEVDTDVVFHEYLLRQDEIDRLRGKRSSE